MPRGSAKSLTRRQSDVRNRALRVLARMRRGESLSRAARAEHIKPETAKKKLGSTVRQEKPGGRFRATKSDRFRRDLQIPTALGMAPISVHGSKQASFLAEYLSAVGKYLRTGDERVLEKFKGKSIASHTLITDPSTLSALAEADALHLDRLYSSVTGGA